MDHLFAWCAFLGAWLLVAGPLHQATRELSEEDFDRSEWVEAQARIGPPPSVSAWWWLLPPVYYYLRHQRGNVYREELLAVMAPEKVVTIERFRDKADAWLYVAAGAFLIGAKATWDLRQDYGWPAGVLWGLIALMTALCVVNAAARARRRQRVNKEGGQGSGTVDPGARPET